MKLDPNNNDAMLKCRRRCVAFVGEKEDIVVVYDDGSWKHLGTLPPDLEEFLMEGERKKNIFFL